MEQRIVIGGGGFVGLRLARLLAKRLRGQARIILIDKNERFVFSPWLIDALAGALDREQYSEVYASAAKRAGFEFIRAEIKDVNRHAKVVDTVDAHGNKQVVGYDLLVVCPGARPAYYGIQGAEQSAHPLKGLEHIDQLHKKISALIRQARTAAPEERKKLLHFIVVGGGPSGIEALFALKSYLECQACCDAPGLVKELRFTLVEGKPNVLHGFREKISDGARRELERQGVDLKTNMHATSMEDGLIRVNGDTIQGGLILWCGGVQANDLSFIPDVARDEKRNLTVNPTLGLGEDIFGAGDAVLCIGGDGHPVPRTAQIAMVESEMLADNIVRKLKGEALKDCRPLIKGNLITLGDTGYIDTPWFAIKTKLTIPLRRLFYRFRFWQMTGT
jgi:NADH dehydrogenase